MTDPATPPSSWDPDALGVLMAPVTGTSLPAWAGQALEAGLASVILFAHNTPDPATTAALVRSVHDRSPAAVVAIDEEGGDVSRLHAGEGSPLPTAWTLGEVDDEALTREAGAALGGMLAAVGIDLALAPVLDVSTDPANPVIGTRAFGDDPGRVARHAAAVAAGLRAAGVGSCGKHFPGHGATATDSHTALPRIGLGLEELRREHLEPWRIAGRLDAVMTAHVLVPALGEGPASIAPWSRPVLEELLGGPLPGLLITDALDMAAVAAEHGHGEAAVRAVEAGADLLCLGTSIRRDDAAMLREAHDALLAAVSAGRLTRQELHERAERTRNLCVALRERREQVPAPAVAEARERAARIGAEAAARGVRGTEVRLDAGEVQVLDLRGRPDHASGARAVQLLRALAERGREARLLADPAEIDPAAGPVVAVTRLPRADAAEAERLAALRQAHPKVVLVHTGVPAAAADHPRRVLAHGAGLTALRAAVELLLGPGTAARDGAPTGPGTRDAPA